MKEYQVISRLFLIALCFCGGNCGDVVIGFSPSNLRFGVGSSLHLSNLDDVLAASLGYTPHNFIWSGLTVTTPFRYPSAVVVLGVRDAGVPIRLEGTTYDLKEDGTLKNTYDDLTSLIGNRAQRPVYFKDITASDLVRDSSSKYTIAATKSLKSGKDSVFLKEMAVLPNLVDYIEPASTSLHGGQDVIFVDIESFAQLVIKYGSDSDQVKEASQILRSSIAQTISRLEKFYSGEVVVVSSMLSNSDQPRIRKKRAIGDVEATVDINLSPVYDEDYPVIFNIILILSIMLALSILAISVATAFMDPGRDSIIYRMTNPRMKKDQ